MTVSFIYEHQLIGLLNRNVAGGNLIAAGPTPGVS